MPAARLVVDFGLVVLIWLVQLIIYPSFRYMSPEQLAVWHPKYTNLITVIVGPLMLAQVGLVGWELFTRFSWLALISAVLVGLTWVLTVFQAIPLHNQIAAGINLSDTIERLISANWLRTVIWTVIFLLGLVRTG
ncbi:hypothetical protein BN8_01109 [Fibrisoma limi BUZ 3]|uniref:DUF1772 domain-containing protein n=1 Tax=Fibrisoma limi BUZ 3 TaxID=1185876 RepID=I2GE10_9BACT|nr:hypothetical protein [Fibrisoma limi]CCH52135.1 hypothetical protein BN8_01109 [Fibrisoma limi BUZ 3]